MLRRYQLKLVAQAGANHHTMRSFLIGYVHSVLLYGCEAVLPCIAPTYLQILEVRYRESCKASLGLSTATENSSVYLEANLLPLSKLSMLRVLAQHERFLRLPDTDGIRRVIYTQPAPPTINRRTTKPIPLPRETVLKELKRVCDIIGIPTDHPREPLICRRVSPWETELCHFIRFHQPQYDKDASEEVDIAGSIRYYTMRFLCRSIKCINLWIFINKNNYRSFIIIFLLFVSIIALSFHLLQF
ncbi:putative mucin TcMUCII [Trypanosoma theileri]|uniref:Putative mucin TcMUCII n=1 Tax=Trypanosoma theileri TaxID=67003 RepID=A0A1X0P9T3_9TRYP|nr:putative mucin TcMUCII [Trypanosoma theileri]ORC93694.1 putative mucin TcMUCII [Trypanosoma theileri]